MMTVSNSDRHRLGRLINTLRTGLLFGTAWIVAFVFVIDYPIEEWAIAIGTMYVMWWALTQLVILVTIPILQYLSRRIRVLSAKLRVTVKDYVGHSPEDHLVVRMGKLAFAFGVFFMSLGGTMLAASPTLTAMGLSDAPASLAQAGLVLLGVGAVGWALLMAIPVLTFVLASLLVIFIENSLEGLQDLSDDLSARKTLTRRRGIFEILIP